MSKTIFISRSLDSESPILALTKSSSTLKVIDQSLIDISPIKVSNIPETSWLFFYSKNGIKYFIEAAEDRQFSWKHKKIGVMGTASNKAIIKARGKESDFICRTDLKESANNFHSLLGANSILFVRAKHSKKSIQNYISKNQVRELVIYNNTPKTELSIPPCDILVFTSPMNVNAYLNQYSISKGQTVIAIGQTTKKHLSQFVPNKVHMPSSASESDLAILIKDKI